MSLDKMNIESWNCSNRLMKAYQNYQEKGKVETKGQLAIAGTTHAVKTVAWGALSSVGFVFYALTLGHYKNVAWHNAKLNAEMTKAAFYALFRFKPAMEQLRMAEAASYCHEFSGVPEFHLVPSKDRDWLEPKTVIAKLKKLDEAQLKKVLYSSPFESERFISLLQQYRKEADKKIQTVLDEKIASIQTAVYSKSNLITCTCKKEVKFVDVAHKELLQAIYPNLNLNEIVEKKGAKALNLTQDQFQFCEILAKTPEARVVPSPTSLEALYKYNQEKKLGNQLITKLVPIYMERLMTSPVPYTDIEIASLETLAKSIPHRGLQRACLLYSPSMSPQKLAEACLKMLVGAEALTALETEKCFQALLEDKSGSWLKNSDEKALKDLAYKIYSSNYHDISKDYSVEFMKLCLESGELKFLSVCNLRIRQGEEDEEQLLAAWEKAQEPVKSASLPLLIALCSSYNEKLVKALEAYAYDEKNIKAAPNACEEALISRLKNWENAGKGAFGHANQNLNKLVINFLITALDYKLTKLNDTCVDVILSNVALFGSMWLINAPVSITSALIKTNRKADWDHYRVGKTSALNCANEGLELMNYVTAHPNEKLADACKAYIRRNWGAYKTAVQELPVADQGKYAPLLEVLK